MNGCEAAGDLALIQTSLLLSCKLCCCNANYSILTLQKHEGLYQNRVTGSLASIARPGNLATTVKWSIYKTCFDIFMSSSVANEHLTVVHLNLY